jgi:hypothetical protein
LDDRLALRNLNIELTIGGFGFGSSEACTTYTGSGTFTGSAAAASVASFFAALMADALSSMVSVN